MTPEEELDRQLTRLRWTLFALIVVIVFAVSYVIRQVTR